MADHENIVKQRLNLPLTRSNLLLFLSRWLDTVNTVMVEQRLKGEFHGSAHARILTGLCTLSGTGPGFSLFMNQSWASYLILHANSPKIINRGIYLLGQQINSTVHCVGKICWNPLRILVIQLLPRLTVASDYWTTSQWGFWSDNID